MERRLSAIFAADMVGYSRLMEADELGTLNRQKVHRLELIDPAFQKFRGRIVKEMGDGVLVEFPSVVEAVSCAVAIQSKMAERELDVPEDSRIAYRIGINIGDVIVEADDIYGEGVNVAARLEKMAEPGGICISRPVRTQIRGKLDLDLEDLGEKQVKNIAQPVSTYGIVINNKAEALVADIAFEDEPSDIGAYRAAKRNFLPLMAVASAFLLVVFTGGYWWWSQQPISKRSEGAGNQISTVPTESDKPIVAVLPFVNTSQDPGEDYFADGMTNDLITDLSKVSGLFVIARNSVFAYKGQIVDMQEVGRDLGARYLLEGNVRRAGDRVRINALLVDVSTGHQLWAERYDRNQADVFDVQDEVIARIVSALSIKLTQSEQSKLSRPPTSNMKAYDHFLRAEQQYHTGGARALQTSLRAYEAAIAEDPKFAKAFAHYARAASDAWRLDYISVMPGPLARQTANDAARRAIELDPDNSDAHSVIAISKMVAGEHTAAVDEARRAIYFDPNNADALLTLAIVLSYAGRHGEALESVTTAIRLNPKPPPRYITYYGLILILNGQFEQAVEEMEPFRDQTLAFPALGDSLTEVLSIAYVLSGREEEARSLAQEMIRATSFTNLAYYGVIYQHYKRQKDLDFRLDAMRRAGVPDWPLDYRGQSEYLLDETEIEALSSSKAWKGWDTSRGLNFNREANSDGAFVYANAETLMTGTVTVRGNMLCERLEILMLGRPQCGYVYRNPEGTREEFNEYEYVTPTTILRFSITN